MEKLQAQGNKMTSVLRGNGEKLDPTAATHDSIHEQLHAGHAVKG